MPDVRERLAEMGADPAGSTTEAFRAFIEGEITRWRKLIKPAMNAAK